MTMATYHTTPGTTVQMQAARLKSQLASALPRHGVALTLAGVLLALVIWGLAISAFGYPAIILPAITAVPVMFVVLILITVGK